MNDRDVCVNGNKRSKSGFIFWLLILIFILADQAIELVVWNFFMDYSGTAIIGNIVCFCPVINTYLSFINSLLGIPANMVVINIINALIIYFAICLKKYLAIKGVNSRLIYWGILFSVASDICTIIDRIFWGGSLDFICIRGLFIFGPENVYFAIAFFCLILYCVLNYRVVGKLKSKDVFSYIKYCFLWWRKD